MTQTFSPNAGLPYIDLNAQKHLIANAAFEKLDALVMLAVLDRDLTGAPSTPADGDRHLVRAAGWTSHPGKAGQIAHFTGNAWSFYPPNPGWLCFVADDAVLLVFDGAAWTGAAGVIELQNLPRLGIGTTADAANPLAAKLNNALWVAKPVAEGGDGDLRYKLSKESATKTLSLLFQTNYSGRAEFGLAGDDNVRLKVSADGASWSDSFTVERTSGAVGFASSVQVASTAASTSATTGALTVSGGVGVAGKLSMGANIVLPNGGGLRALDTGGTERSMLTFFTNNAVYLDGGTNGLIMRVNNGTQAATFNASSALRLHGYGAGSLVTDASGNVTASSDERLKRVDGAFARTIRDLMDHDCGRPVRFHWTEASGLDAATEYVGFLAQDYARGVPEAVGTDPRGHHTFSDRVALAVLHNTAFDHEARIDALTQANAALAQRLVELEAQFDATS